MANSFNQIMRDMRLVEGDKVFSVNCSIGIAMIKPGAHRRGDPLACRHGLLCREVARAQPLSAV
jgi:hypothetical protein